MLPRRILRSRKTQKRSLTAALRFSGVRRVLEVTSRAVGAVIFAFVILAGPAAVRARLNEDADQIEKEYGPLVQRHLRDNGMVMVAFHRNKNPYVYVVLFDKGMSVSEKISRIDGREFTEKEIAKFLKQNAARAKWTNKNDKERGFERSDHRAEAVYGKVDGKPTLTVRKTGSGEEK